MIRRCKAQKYEISLTRMAIVLKCFLTKENKLAIKLFENFKHSCVCYSTGEKLKPEKKKYANTVRLPYTQFPLRLDGEKRIERDIFIHKNCGFDSLYEWQRENVEGSEFILHDGPPYANGKPHIGHAINKILKDIIIRKRLLAGHRIHYVPGWDCHGLPIELKALNGQTKLSAIDIRTKAEKFAREAITDQKEAFRSWGVMANWKDCYFTFDKQYVKNQLHHFWKLHEKLIAFLIGRTALAEAELEYNPHHRSTSVTIRVQLEMLPTPVRDHALFSNATVYALVWTTTPWTLPMNEAVCFNSELNYSLVTLDGHTGELYIVASDLIDVLKENYLHPLKPNQSRPFLPAEHVTSSKGTGLVHTAPAHGQDDFLVALRHSIPVVKMYPLHGGCSNSGGGLMTQLERRPYWCISRQRVWGVPIPVFYLKSSGKPLINRSLVDRLCQLIDEYGTNFWWTLPLEDIIRFNSSIDSHKYGKFHIECDCNIDHCKYHQFKDILDIWFDSGLSWYSVLGENKTADMYLEGVDQFTGWFQSSLMTSIALRDEAPYRLYCEPADSPQRHACQLVMGHILEIVTRAMAPVLPHLAEEVYLHHPLKKVLQLYCEPADSPQRRACQLVMGHILEIVTRAMAPVLPHLAEEVYLHHPLKKGMQIFRSGVITPHPEWNQPEVAKVVDLALEVKRALNKMSTCTNTFQLDLSVFASGETYSLLKSIRVVNHLLSLLLRLYCEPADSPQRHACQLVMGHILEIVTRAMAPVLPHLAEEVYLHHPLKKGMQIFRSGVITPHPEWNQPEVAKVVDLALEVKRALNKMSTCTNTFQLDLSVFASGETYSLLKVCRIKISYKISKWV
ncbi:hypothetical protein C0J52_26258 [Blattella germanica]|nr:hypothetical protein C0J52_26258 [Blattella germanica]